MPKSESKESYLDLAFPLAGIDRSGPFGRQNPRPLGNGQYGRTTPYGKNVRAFDSLGRARGGSRSGLSRYVNAIPGGTAGLIQELAVIVSTAASPPGGTVQDSESDRVVTLFTVIGGVPYVANAGNTSWTSVTNSTANTIPFNTTGVVRSAVNNQKLYLVDGTHNCIYDPATNALTTWTASDGSFPVDSSGNYPRLIKNWRNRIVLSGLLRDPHNWFMSAVDDPRDFNYSPDETTPTQAVAGNNSSLGQIGDVVTGLIPYTDDVLIFTGDHTLFQMSGDPMQGGALDSLSHIVGGAFGEAYCMGPGGEIFFFANRGGIWSLVPGRQLVRISQQIEQYLQAVNTGTHAVRMAWDEKQQGFHVFVTKMSASAVATHFFYELRSTAWWVDTFVKNDMNPLTCTVFDGNTEDDRVTLIGSWDGYVRGIDHTADDDDGQEIRSEVWLGPILTTDLDDVLLKDVQGVLGETSGTVTWAMHVGTTAEEAFASEAVLTGTWGAGRNPTHHVRRSGWAVYVKLTSTVEWALEAVRCRLQMRGMVRRRKPY